MFPVNRIHAAIIVFLCIFAPYQLARGNAQKLRHSITVQEAFFDSSQPFVRRGRYTPITVIISNSHPKTIPGMLRVYRTQAPKAPLAKRPLYYSKRVKVTPGSRRETIHYFVQTKLEKHCLAVVFEPDNSTNEALTEPIFPSYRILSKQVAVLLVSNKPVPRSMFVGAKIAGPEFQSKTVVIERQPQDIPDSRLGYDAYSAVGLIDCDLQESSKIQRQALIDWISTGGAVFVVPGDQPFNSQTHSLRSLLPIQSQGAVVDKPWSQCQFLGGVKGPGQVRIHQFQVKSAGTVLESHEDGHPLVVSGSYGAGSVHVFAFPISSRSMRRWISGRSLFARLLPHIYENDSALSTISPIMEWQLNRTSFFEGSSPVSLFILGPILFLYALLVCPVAFHFGRSKRSPAMFIAAMLVMIVLTLISVLAIVLATKANESKAAINSLITLPYLPENPKNSHPDQSFEAKIESVIGSVQHFSGKLTTKAQDKTLIAPWLTNERQIQGEILEPKLNQANIHNQRVISGAFQRFYQRSYQKLGQLSGSVGIDKAYIVGELKNQSQFNFDHAFLVFSGQIAELGPMPANQSLNKRIPLYPLTLSSKIFKKFAECLKLELKDYHRYFFEALPSEEFDVDVHLLKMFRSLSHSANASRGQPTAFLIAFAEDSKVQFQSNFNESVDSKSSLILAKIPLKLAKSRIRMIELQGLVCSPTEVSILRGQKATEFGLESPETELDPASTVSFSFAVPKVPNCQTLLEKFTIAMTIKPEFPVLQLKDETKDLIIEIFHPKSQSYKILSRWDGKKFRARLNDPERYFDPRTHEVRIRVRNEIAASGILVSNCRARFMAQYQKS